MPQEVCYRSVMPIWVCDLSISKHIRVYPSISKYFLKYSYASHLTHVPDHSSSYRLMLLNAEFPAGLWTKNGVLWLPWLRKFGICSSPWFSSLCVQFQDAGGSGFCRRPPGHQIPTLHLGFWWISWKFPIFTRGNSDFFVSFRFFPQLIFADYMWFLLFKLSMGLQWFRWSRFRPATFPRDQFKSILELVKRSETLLWSDCAVPLSCPP